MTTGSLPNLMQGISSQGTAAGTASNPLLNPLLNQYQNLQYLALARNSQNGVNSSTGIQNLQGAQSNPNWPYGTNYADSLTNNYPSGGAATPLNMRNLP